MLGVAAVPSVLQGLALLLLPESPRWLAGRGQLVRAKQVMAQLRPPEALAEELRELESDVRVLVQTRKKTFFRTKPKQLFHDFEMPSFTWTYGCGGHELTMFPLLCIMFHFVPTHHPRPACGRARDCGPRLGYVHT